MIAKQDQKSWLKAHLHGVTLNLHTLACIFSCLSIVSVDGKKYLSEVVFSVQRKMMEWIDYMFVPIHPRLITSDYGVHEVGVTVCGVQHVLGLRVQPGNQIVPSFSLQWKSNKSTKHYLTPMLLAINWHYWQEGKNPHVYEGSRSSHISTLH